MTEQIPYHDFGGDGPLLHFAAPNAYTPQTFRQFIEPFLAHFHVVSVLHRPLWADAAPESVADVWQQTAVDLQALCAQQGWQNVIGMGHSLGGVATAYTAVTHPQLFSQLVLIDPVFLPPDVIELAKANPAARGFKPMVDGALRRRNRWQNRQDAFDRFRDKRVFGRWSDDALWDYVNFAIKDDVATDEVTLAWPREWEARFYATPPLAVWTAVAQLTQPTLAIRAGESDTLYPPAWAHWQQLQPQATFVELPDVGHMMMMERPLRVAQTVLDYLVGE